MNSNIYGEISSIINNYISDEKIKEGVITAIEYYQKIQEEKKDLSFYIFDDRPSEECVFKYELAVWKSDEEKIKVINEIHSKFKDCYEADSISYFIAKSLEKEKSKCLVIDNCLLKNPDTIIDSLGVKKKNEYSVRLLGEKFIKFFLTLSKDRQIQLLDDLNNCKQSYENATADILYRLNIDDLIAPTEQIQEFNINKNISIGVELETVGKASNLLLYKSDYLVDYKKTLLGNEWNVSIDDSLGVDGIELISPVMHNTKKDCKQLYAIFKFLNLIGNSSNENCGGHIHIGADYLKSKYSLANLYEIIGNCEEIYYLISCGEGKFVPSRINKPIKPISEKLNLAIKEGGINIETQQLVTTLKRIQGEVSDGRNNIADKHYGINILNYGRKELLSKNTNMHTGINTIEFRAFANPEDYKTCLENIFLVGRLMEVSEELGQIDLKKDRSQEEKRKIELREKLKEDIPSHEKIEYFLDLIFEKDKDIYMDRFVENYKILEKEENKAIKNKIAFHKIDFGERVIEKEDIIR